MHSAKARLFRIVLIAFVLAAVTYLAVLQSEVGSLRAQARVLRDELGYLEIDDPTKICARGIDSGSPLSWRWKLYLPPGPSSYILFARTREIERTGASPGDRVFSMCGEFAPGEHEFTAAYEIDQHGQKWLYVRSQARSVGFAEHAPPSGFLDWTEGKFALDECVEKSAAFDPGRPVTMLRLRALQSADGRPAPDGEAAPGVLIWIERRRDDLLNNAGASPPVR